MSRYLPINCEFHDVLEATATRGRVASIVYMDVHGQRQAIDARIVDLLARHGEEHLQLDDGRRLRLDRIVSVDGVRADAFAQACALPH